MSRLEPITFRIYGDNLTLPRAAWEALLADMDPGCDNARRLRERLAR